MAKLLNEAAQEINEPTQKTWCEEVPGSACELLEWILEGPAASCKCKQLQIQHRNLRCCSLPGGLKSNDDIFYIMHFVAQSALMQ